MIVEGRIYPEPPVCDGLLFIGDPHCGSIRPGRRIEENWASVGLGKLARCAEIAAANNFFPILTGDLFEDAVEPSEGLKTRLTRVLKRFPFVPLSNTGNHDMSGEGLSDEDSLSLLAENDALDVVTTSGAVCEFVVAGRRIGLGMTPYGQTIPTDVTGLFPEAEKVVWITHHDIAFENPYPGSIPPFEIAGCDLVVNGHVHARKPPVRKGGTVWFNPGNILRLSVDLLEHDPAVFSLSGPKGELVKHPVVHDRHVFDLSGYLVPKAGRKEAAASYAADRTSPRTESAFVSLLQSDASLDMRKSQDGAMALEEMEHLFEELGTRPDVRTALRAILAQAVEKRSGRHAAAD